MCILKFFIKLSNGIHPAGRRQKAFRCNASSSGLQCKRGSAFVLHDSRQYNIINWKQVN